MGVLKNEDPLKTHVLYGKYSEQDEDFDVDEVRACNCTIVMANELLTNDTYTQCSRCHSNRCFKTEQLNTVLSSCGCSKILLFQSARCGRLHSFNLQSGVLAALIV
jgi:hypothetical protein